MIMDILNKITGNTGDDDYDKSYDNDTSPEELLKLAESDDEEVRQNVASNTSSPITALEKLSQDEDSTVRQYVAENANCTPELLKKLSQDEDNFVRSAIAENANCTPELLKKLSQDEDTWVRLAVAKNSTCSDETLEILSNDEDRDVVMAALHGLFKNNPKLIEKFLKSDNKYHLYGIADYEGTPENILLDIALGSDHFATSFAVGNISLSANSLKKVFEEKLQAGLGKDDQVGEMDSIADHMAGNDNLSTEVLDQLASWQLSSVREKVAIHSNTALSTLKKLIDDSNGGVQNEALLKIFSKDEPKDEILQILEYIISSLTAGEGKVGEFGGIDVVSGLTQEEVDNHIETAKERIEELNK